MSDHTLENAVMQALAENRRVHADEIAVQAIDGTVVLRGTVGSLVQQAEAARTARHVLRGADASKISCACGRWALTGEPTPTRRRRCSPR